MSPLALLFIRVVIYVFACGISYVCLMSLVVRIEGGSFYSTSDAPSVPMDAAHKRARRTLLVTAALLAIAMGLTGYLLRGAVSVNDWLNFGRPAMVGALFAMAYAALCRSNMIRPRP